MVLNYQEILKGILSSGPFPKSHNKSEIWVQMRKGTSLRIDKVIVIREMDRIIKFKYTMTLHWNWVDKTSLLDHDLPFNSLLVQIARREWVAGDVLCGSSQGLISLSHISLVGFCLSC